MQQGRSKITATGVLPNLHCALRLTAAGYNGIDKSYSSRPVQGRFVLWMKIQYYLSSAVEAFGMETEQNKVMVTQQDNGTSTKPRSFFEANQPTISSPELDEFADARCG